jgi:hypothetical protein
LRDRTKLEDDADAKHAEMLIQRLFGETEHSAIFKQMIMGSMSHFKQLTTYAIPFLLITWLRQLKEHFFLHPKDDFFEQGMYTAFSSSQKIQQRVITFGCQYIQKKGIHEKVELLAYFKPKQRKGVCVTLREWAAFIFKCEFEPQTLDASSKEILKSTLLKKKKYEMKDNDLNWAQVHKEEEKNSKEKTPINVSLMKDKDLYLIVCEAMKAGGSNTKNNREKK